MSARDTLRQQVSDLLSEVVGSASGIDTTTEFTETGMSSIEYLELIDRIETRFSVVIDLDADETLTTVDKFADLLLRQGVSA
jgi:acyl carrier protein